jgi:hypothetical protein
MNPVVLAVIAAFATVPLAALSWFLVEKPPLSLKSRLERRSVGRGPSGCVDNPALAQTCEFSSIACLLNVCGLHCRQVSGDAKSPLSFHRTRTGD